MTKLLLQNVGLEERKKKKKHKKTHSAQSQADRATIVIETN